MATELPPIVVDTPAPTSVIRTTVKRSWKGRALIIASASAQFVLALLAYLQTVNLQNFGLTAERALFAASAIGLAQFVLLQINPVKLVRTEAEPGSAAEQP